MVIWQEAKQFVDEVLGETRTLLAEHFSIAEYVGRIKPFEVAIFSFIEESLVQEYLRILNKHDEFINSITTETDGFYWDYIDVANDAYYLCCSVSFYISLLKEAEFSYKEVKDLSIPQIIQRYELYKLAKKKVEEEDEEKSI